MMEKDHLGVKSSTPCISLSCGSICLFKDSQFPRYLDDASANVALNDLKAGKRREAFGGHDSEHFGGCIFFVQLM